MRTPLNTTATYFALATLLPLGTLACPTASAADIDSVWTARGDGSWNVAGNWSPKGVPDNGGAGLYSVFIVSGALVAIDSSVTVSNLTLGLSDHLRITNSRILLRNFAAPLGGLRISTAQGGRMDPRIGPRLAVRWAPLPVHCRGRCCPWSADHE